MCVRIRSNQIINIINQKSEVLKHGVIEFNTSHNISYFLLIHLYSMIALYLYFQIHIFFYTENNFNNKMLFARRNLPEEDEKRFAKELFTVI